LLRRTAIAVLLASFASFTSTPARAEPRLKVAGICAGCLASVARGSDEKSEPAPLLVTLHGDWGPMAPELHAAWERVAAPRGIALLSLSCPADLGCKRSWWKWNGDPAWISEQIDRLAARHAIDRERVWLAGWSGGAAWMGMHAQELEPTFAALLFHGGGIWPSRAGCAPEKVPVFFLAGDQNPLHAHVLGLRKHYERCENEVSFQLLRGADHNDEWMVLNQRAGEVIDWLASKRRRTVAVVSAVAPPASAPVTVPPETTAPSPSMARPRPPQPSPLPPHAGCGCEVMGGAARAPWLVGIGVGLLGLLATRRAGRRRGV